MKAKNSSKNQDYMQQVTARETEILLQELTKTLTHNIPGDVVEFGCYKADTSVLYQKLLESMGHGGAFQPENQAAQASQKTLWLYDSFEGLPAKTREDNSAAGDAFQAGELLVTKREVIEKFKKMGLRLPKIKKAFFDDLDIIYDIPEKISYAFLDGDLYQSIKTSLRLVTDKMSQGGVIIVHDYNNPELPGSARAVDEWLKSHQVKVASFRVAETLAIIYCA
ncbi:class I SAM-dependent methyltransferase [Candidatus Saccharibacteria bacterium]|nr:class I SAM-dependent methyltransferase [Candidatus Saccharibacteria bacterium]